MSVSRCHPARWRGAVSNDQLRLERRRASRCAALQVTDDVLGDLLAHPPARYAGRRQWRIEMRRHVGIVEADDAEVAWHREAERLGLDHGAGCYIVVCAYQGRWAQRIVRQDLAHPLPTACDM